MSDTDIRQRYIAEMQICECKYKLIVCERVHVFKLSLIFSYVLKLHGITNYYQNIFY